MSDLVLHIGFPKTGTTSLQNNIFSKNENYLGICPDKKLDKADLLYDIFVDYSKGKNVSNEIKKWERDVKDIIWSNCVGDAPALVSSEFFFDGNVNRVIEFPLVLKSLGQQPSFIDFVDFINKKIWLNGAVKVIITIRDEIDWIGSKYAEASANIFMCSQKKFEKSIKKYCSLEDDSWINWHKTWVRPLERVLGSRNVLVLSSQDLYCKASLAKKLNNFAPGLVLNNIDESDDALRNKKNIGFREWKVSRYSMASSYKKRMSAHFYRREKKGLVYILFIVFKIMDRVISGLLQFGRGKSIHINHGIEEKIRFFLENSESDNHESNKS